MSVYNEMSLDSAMDDGTSKYMLDGNWSIVSIQMINQVFDKRKKCVELAKISTDFHYCIFFSFPF